MKRAARLTEAEKVVRRISELRNLARRLAKAGYEAGLHGHDPALKVAESHGKYAPRKER
jgi:hypothetical protein